MRKIHKETELKSTIDEHTIQCNIMKYNIHYDSRD